VKSSEFSCLRLGSGFHRSQVCVHLKCPSRGYDKAASHTLWRRACSQSIRHVNSTPVVRSCHWRSFKWHGTMLCLPKRDATVCNMWHYLTDNFKTYKFKILPVVFYGSETLSHTHWECLRTGCWGEYLDLIKDNEIGAARSTHGICEKCLNNFCWKMWREETTLEKWNRDKEGVRLWTGLLWLRTETNGGLLRAR
jgi:hypothetical protein